MKNKKIYKEQLETKKMISINTPRDTTTTPIPKLNVRHKAKPNALDDDDIAIILSKMDDDVDDLQNEHNEHISDSK